MNSELLAEWIRRDGETFLRYAQEAHANEKEMQDKHSVASEMYYKGQAYAYESVLRIAYKHYLNLFLLLEEGKEDETL